MIPSAVWWGLQALVFITVLLRGPLGFGAGVLLANFILAQILVLLAFINLFHPIIN